MLRSLSRLTCALALLAAAPVHAQRPLPPAPNPMPGPPAPAPAPGPRPLPPAPNPMPAPAFDPTGWTLLGEQPVNGRKDRDRFVVPAYTGRFDQITLVVRDSDVVIEDVVITFANGETFRPGVRHAFREGARSRVIDLPGNNRRITTVEVLARNVRGGGRASVAFYARDTQAGASRPLPPAPSPMPAPSPAFDPTGWTLLGAQSVDGRRDRDVIRVGRWQPFDQLVLVVKDSDLDLRELTVEFADGTTWRPRVENLLAQDRRTRILDLPGKDRAIKAVRLAYANLPGGGKASVELYGRDTGRPAPQPVGPVAWDSKGWTRLGSRTVDGWRDRDALIVNAPRPFSELTFAVSGSDVAITKVIVTFGNREKVELLERMVFAEGARTRPIDLPGKLRKIRSIEFFYENLPGGGKATVDVWARSRR